MGTKTDFYVGRGAGAEWIGSVAYDGWPWVLARTEWGARVFVSVTEATFRGAVDRVFLDRGDATVPPRDAWPWPWPDSNTSDHAVAFDGGAVYVTCPFCGWVPAAELLDGPAAVAHAHAEAGPADRVRVEFPAMPAWRPRKE